MRSLEGCNTIQRSSSTLTFQPCTVIQPNKSYYPRPTRHPRRSSPSHPAAHTHTSSQPVQSLTPPPFSLLSPPIQPSQKTFRTKQKLAKAARQNRPIPQWFRLKTDSTYFHRLSSMRKSCMRRKCGNADIVYLSFLSFFFFFFFLNKQPPSSTTPSDATGDEPSSTYKRIETFYYCVAIWERRRENILFFQEANTLFSQGNYRWISPFL